MATGKLKRTLCSFLHVTTLMVFCLFLHQVNPAHAAVTTDPDRTTDPLAGFHFALEIDGKLEGYFTDFSGAGSESEVIIHTDQKIPGKLVWHDVRLSRGITSNLYLWTWRKQVEDGDIEAARQDFNVVMFDQEGTELNRWQFINGWPSGILTAKVTTTADSITGIEEITIVHDGGYLQQPSDGPCQATGDGDEDDVCNNIDNCPVIANPEQTDTDGDNTGDACDACANDGSKTLPGICGCGIADIDSDNDGVMDCKDTDDVPEDNDTIIADTAVDNDGTPETPGNSDLASSDESDNKRGIFSVNSLTLFVMLLLTIFVRHRKG